MTEEQVWEFILGHQAMIEAVVGQQLFTSASYSVEDGVSDVMLRLHHKLYRYQIFTGAYTYVIVRSIVYDLNQRNRRWVRDRALRRDKLA